MKKSKIISGSFIITDMLAWVMVFISFATAILMPFNSQLSVWTLYIESQPLAVTLESLTAFIQGLGFLLLVRRVALGFILILITAISYMLVTKEIIGIYYFCIIFIVFGAPWVLSFIQISRASRN